MRSLVVLVAAIFVAIGAALGALGASSDTSLVNYATIATALGSTVAFPDVQIAVAFSSPREPLFGEISYVMDESSDRPGIALSHAGHRFGTAAFLFVNHVQLLDLYVIDERTLYVKVNFLAFAPLVTSPDTRRELLNLQASLGGRWYKLPTFALPLNIPSATPASTAAAEQLMAGLKGVLQRDAALAPVTGPHDDAGVEVSGSGSAILGAAVPLLQRFGTAIGDEIPLTLPSTSALGTVRAAFYLDRSSALREITFAVQGTTTFATAVVVNHNRISIIAPPNPRPLPRSAIERLVALARSLALEHAALAATALSPAGVAVELR